MLIRALGLWLGVGCLQLMHKRKPICISKEATIVCLCLGYFSFGCFYPCDPKTDREQRKEVREKAGSQKIVKEQPTTSHVSLVPLRVRQETGCTATSGVLCSASAGILESLRPCSGL